jgi:hypothetical protein
MSTRGTYRVEEKLLYNHFDNYPAGAAMHFLKVVEQGKALNYVNLIRNTESCDFQPAQSIFDGPAEFHYKIKVKDGKTMIETNKIKYESDDFIYVDDVELDVFINRELKKHCDNEKEYKENEVLKISHKYANCTSYGTRKYFTEKRNKMFDSAMAMLMIHGGVGNASGEMHEVGELTTVLNDARFAENYNKFIAPIFQKAYDHKTADYFEIKLTQEVTA